MRVRRRFPSPPAAGPFGVRPAVGEAGAGRGAAPAALSGRLLFLAAGLFFLWGAANNLNDVLVAHFRALFRLTDLQSGLVQSAFYLGYFCCAVPAALVGRRFGYRAAIVAGLLLFAFGALLFWPASYLLSYGAFLVALFVIASGLAFLETAANPMVAALGDPAGAVRRLTFVQAFNPLGSIAGVGLGLALILSDDARPAAAQAAAVRLPYLLVAGVTLLWAVLIRRADFPAAALRGGGEAAPALAEYRALLARPRYLAGVAAQFAYVGAQVGVWSFLIRYATAALPGLGVRRAGALLTLSLALFMAGRFAGAAAMRRVAGAPLLLALALADAALCIVAVGGGAAGVAALVAASAGMSIMYPTIFVLASRGLGPLAKAGASPLVMAIVGGAAVSALMGWASDRWGSIALAMLVPAACFAAVAAFAALHLRTAEEGA